MNIKKIGKKRKCLNCNSYFLESESIKTNFGYFHNNDCRKEYGINNAKKIIIKTKKNIDKEKKVSFYANDLKTRKEAAKKACHAYIRARDSKRNCICCNKPINKQMHAGHFLESGNNPFLRYNEYNINGQRAYCNTYKGGDSGDYELNLRAKIGDEKVDYLLKNKGRSCKRTVDDYIEIEKYYKEKIKYYEN